ncbi:MAG: arginine N-succinyltransferase [Deltaproteobacteria bacterium]|nr:arginine N-succinyltransferase [Deltaproteobacteria bacterium]
MIILREVNERDIDGLESLSTIAADRHPGFLNIANDRDQWREKVRNSLDSFADKIVNKMDCKYIIVAEDTEKKHLCGVSMVAAQHGTEETPHFFFEVDNEQKFSQTINTGFIHGTLKLKYDTNGPTEIGGLLVDPEYRNFEERIGRQVSFVRFLYMGIHKAKFKRRVLAELLPPLTKKGKSPLWEAVGRRFTNMDYTEADILSSKNKEFIFSLFPTGKIYVTFLPAEARNAIGKVSRETEPVMHMLKKIGFEYRSEVDPFDGGPHLSANMDEILPIKQVKPLVYGGDDEKGSAAAMAGLVTPRQAMPFRAVSVLAAIDGGNAFFSATRADAIGLKIGDPIYFMPYY